MRKTLTDELAKLSQEVFEKETNIVIAPSGNCSYKGSPCDKVVYWKCYAEWIKDKISTSGNLDKDCFTCCHHKEDENKPPCNICSKNYWSNWEKSDT